tara:strand:- start:22947 stop:23138 length:192 start_codon:yes stop_codon:yes gene_type:complete
MRDPDRIDPIIDKLRELWKKYPDLRLGQLVKNAIRFSPDNESDVFMTEDDVTLKGLNYLLDHE